MKIACTKCPLHKTRTNIVWGTPNKGNLQRDILMIGEAPGDVEDAVGKPFKGGAGKLLWSCIYGSDLKDLKGQIAITNVIKCHPPGNRDPFLSEIAACKSKLDSEIVQYNPKIVIPLGEIALNALTGNTGITTWQGTPIDSTRGLILPCFHPAYAIRQKGHMLAIINVFNKAATLLAYGDWKRLPINYTYDPSPNQLEDLLTIHCYEEKPKGFAFDLETTGLDPYTDKLIGFSFSGIEQKAVSVTLNRKDPYNDPRWKVFEKWLQDLKISKTIQNASFDMFWLQVQGHPVRNLSWDTKLAAGMLYSDLPRDLSWLRSWYTDILPYKEAAKKKGIHNLSKEDLNLYACKDADTTWRVRIKQEKDMKGTQLLKAMENITIPLTNALINISHRGVRVDKLSLIEKTINITPKLEEMEKTIESLGVDPKSPKQVGIHLKSLGMPVKKTPKGNYKTAEPELEALKLKVDNDEQTKFLNNILKHRELQKIKSTYLVGLNQNIRPDGRVHTDFDSAGTSTGRLSSKKPNLQNQPVDDLMDIRSIYIPDPGHYFLSADYNQLELRVGAIVSNCERLINDIESGVYVHGLIGQEMFKVKPEELTYAQKIKAKKIVFGSLYGLSPWTVARIFSVTVKEAERWFDICLTRYSRLLEWRKEVIQEWEQEGFLTSAFGRIRHCNEGTEALNFLVQSPAGDVCSTSLTRAEQQNSKLIKPLLAVHDEILFQVSDKCKIDNAVSRVENIMMWPIKELGYKEFPINIKTGLNWGSGLKELKDE